ncbi:glycosyltransferase family 25 protein [Mesorhizobium sp.]|uniref:glycosyltransferase family 25 protein n=1 Tax=Mesorhizobium sp. TaxID=1871066 RepID=UPI000FE31D9F|nr:glycosyltransferase family 25 protein [Mesorhizobium sp.]RWH69254.1 MAG: glycosyltransferase family 25 protein [Mesorhizobium sp.]RWL27742.1 MAG: glycosyltransferase family 25 protein [Mesorhizobium sp.]RWL29050.1 MAG: glycosyltransferase family 25 protein [Mesorhizobium sp.]RWL34830.1 MAG: glycosyltransferase family 25 protein [Mesorhizobium sp.]RWL46323.1 MAG: glycosyltransferase family 25 protein [Mesorhizobium sp.]
MDRVHVINLDRSLDRLAKFRSVNAHLNNVERFAGADGRGLDRCRLVEENIVSEDLEYTAGSLGCAVSHVRLWKEAVQRDQAITIAEDDAIFSRHFEDEMRSLVGSVKADWDFILWSASLRCYAWLDALPGGTGARLEFFSGDVMSNIQIFQEAHTEPHLLRARHLLGLVCYSVSPRGAQALLDWCLPIRPMIVDFAGFGLRLNNTGIDCLMNGVMPSLKAYVCLPPLVISNEQPEQSVRINT